MTAEEMVAEATRRAREANPGRRRTQGPFAEMLLEAGYPPERVRRCVEFFTVGCRDDMIATIGEANLDSFAAVSEAAIAAAERRSA